MVKNIYFKLFKQLYVTIQLSVNTVLMSKNSSISNNSVKHKHTAACNLKQVLAATPHKTPTVRPPASYHENYSS